MASASSIADNLCFQELFFSTTASAEFGQAKLLLPDSLVADVKPPLPPTLDGFEHMKVEVLDIRSDLDAESSDCEAPASLLHRLPLHKEQALP